MLTVRGIVGGVGLTGTLYGPGEQSPPFEDAPDEDAPDDDAPDDDAPYVRACDEFYEVQNEN